ncbi:hypothetical protein Daura_14170 [Dactylosporangium aurantiacum]|uniref:Adhesin domain-containing protein n=1 Tax=Dactylosporangium aurantiacum TaxID=35754 RepID=A0A9Q9MQ42_9ACTN|nr:hypothetical protein Daura_14170 [Dactylosporangium aurantiacum]
MEEPVTGVLITGATVDVTVKPGDGPVTVVERLRWPGGRAAPRTAHRTVAGRLELSSTGCRRCQVTLTVTVPAATSTEIHIDTGDLTLRDLSGDVSAAVSTGDVTGSGLRGATYRLVVDTGRVELRHATTPTDVVATVDTGEVEVRVPGGASYAVHSDRGLSSVDVARDPASPYTITVNVDTGHAVVHRI